MSKRIVLMVFVSVLFLSVMPRVQLNTFVVADSGDDSGLWVIIEDINGDRLKVETTSVEVWIQLVQLNISGEERWVGGIVEEYANEWGFRFDPDTIFVAEVTIEAIQTTIRGISENLTYWLGNQACVSAKVVEVNTIKVPQDHSTIQSAINAASPGDTIFVRVGTYYENVVVNKTLSLIGENKENTIIDGNETGNVISVIVNNININGFTIRKSGSGYENSGIRLYSSYNKISRNILTDNSVGVIFDDYNYNIVSHNNILNNKNGGISAQNSSYNNISKNNVTANNGYGISIYPGPSSYNSISGNNLTNNFEGIMLGWISSYNVISGNTITDNWAGIWAHAEARYNVISGNNVINNNGGGFRFYPYYSGVCNNRFYHNNFINNTPQVYVSGEPFYDNVWDDGYPSGGNHWSDYNGNDTYSGPYQNVTGSDGIGDTPHIILVNNTDDYPFMMPVALKIVDVLPPFIHSILRTPDTPNYDQNVNVAAIIIDHVGVNVSILSYTYNLTWRNVTMIQVNSAFTAVIPCQPYGTSVEYKIYAVDVNDNWAVTGIYSYIVIDNIPPEISVYWTPAMPESNDVVKVYANLSEPVNASGMDKALFSYKDCFDQWWNTTMRYDVETGLWTVIIPGQPGNTTVQFLIKAFDNAGNIKTSEIYSYDVLPRAKFTSLTLYEVNMFVNETLIQGNNLTVRFYSYSGSYQGEVTVWNGTTPAHVSLSINVSHPLGWPVEKVTLALTDDFGTILQTITTFVVHRSHLTERLVKLDGEWLYATQSERSNIFREIVDIDAQWPYAPS